MYVPHILWNSFRKIAVTRMYETCISCVENQNSKKYRKFTFGYEITMLQRVSKLG